MLGHREAEKGAGTLLHYKTLYRIHLLISEAMLRRSHESKGVGGRGGRTRGIFTASVERRRGRNQRR